MARKKTDEERRSKDWESFYPPGFSVAEAKAVIKAGLPRGTKITTIYARSPTPGWDYGLSVKFTYHDIGGVLNLSGAANEASGTAQIDYAGIVGIGRGRTPQEALRRILSDTRSALEARAPAKKKRAVSGKGAAIRKAEAAAPGESVYFRTGGRRWMVTYDPAGRAGYQWIRQTADGAHRRDYSTAGEAVGSAYQVAKMERGRAPTVADGRGALRSAIRRDK